MRITEKTLFILCVMSIALRLKLVPGGNALVFMSVSLLALFYLVFGFLVFNNIRFRGMFRAVSYKGISAIRIIGAIVAGIVLLWTLSGFIFFFFNWRYGTTLIFTALVVCVITTVICVVKIISKGNVYHKRILTRIVIAGAACFILLAIPQRSFKMFMFRNRPAYIRAAQTARDNPGDTTLQQREQEEYNKMFHN